MRALGRIGAWLYCVRKISASLADSFRGDYLFSVHFWFLKEAAKAEVVSIIPLSRVQVLPGLSSRIVETYQFSAVRLFSFFSGPLARVCLPVQRRIWRQTG